MRDFITCLEFLTRLRFTNRTEWHDDDFSRSVPYFPLVGLVMGLFMGGFKACAVGVSAALIFSYIASLICEPKMKK